MKKSNPVETEYNPNAFKHRFGRDLLNRISKSLMVFYSEFDRKAFSAILPILEPLEMKPRIHIIRDELRRQLPQNYSKALQILLKSARNDKFETFDYWPYIEFVQTYGLDYPEMSLKALKELTTFFTSEWAVRPFIKLHPKLTMDFLEHCTQDKEVHVRRWASEGCRPRLPWGERLQDFVRDPKPTFRILDKLKCDPEIFVRKSVANHLNDIAKDNPEYVIKILSRWKKEVAEKDISKIDWIVKHALRTLIKKGNPAALKLIGVSPAKIKIENFKLKQKKIAMGDRIDFSVDIHSTSSKSQKLVVDYIVHFVKANKGMSAKVFKLKTIQLPAYAVLKIEKSHDFKKITTREYYAGVHGLEVQINGVCVGKREWVLVG